MTGLKRGKIAPAKRNFSNGAYRTLVAVFLARGYETVTFDAVNPAARHLVLRHDVDMCLTSAGTIAELEATIGVHATYFVLMRSEFYNPTSPASVNVLKRIAELGHTVGLHFDAALYPDDELSLEAGAKTECQALETIIGQKVNMVSFHRPAPGFLGRTDRIGGRSHAYEPRFFSDIGYCSDSRGDWYHGHPLDHPSVLDGRALQLVTHPIWWTSDAGESAQSRLQRFLVERLRCVDDELAVHCRAHKPARER